MRVLPRTCPKCGKPVLDDAALFCPYCGSGLAAALKSPPPGKRTDFSIVAGILTIIASCLAAFIGILELIVLPLLFASRYFGLIWMFLGIFGILGFVFGLTGGIFSIRRRHFVLSIVSISLVIVSGFVVLMAPGLVSSWRVGMLFGVPIMILSVLGLIFAAVSKGEFT